MSGRDVSRRQALKITAVSAAALTLGGGLARELWERARLHRVRRTRVQMGTEVTVELVHPDADVARRLVDATFDEIERLEAILSRYRPESPVSRLAREGIVRAPPAELVEVLRRGRNLSERTGGAFDVTVAPLLELYRKHAHHRERAGASSRARSGDADGEGARAPFRARFENDGRGEPGSFLTGEQSPGSGLSEEQSPGLLPSQEEIGAALALVDYRRLRVEDGVVALEQPGMGITLDGIAKGYIVDRAVATLESGGAGQILVEAGGDLATGPGGNGDGWPVAIQDPHDPAGSLGTLRLRGESVASSGDYVHAFTRDRIHHHILDPRTGRSPDQTSGVTVVAASALDADALSTAAFVLGPDEGAALLEEVDGVEGVIVRKDGTAVTTPGLGELRS